MVFLFSVLVVVDYKELTNVDNLRKLFEMYIIERIRNVLFPFLFGLFFGDRNTVKKKKKTIPT